MAADSLASGFSAPDSALARHSAFGGSFSQCRSPNRMGRDETITPRDAPANQLDDGIGDTLVSASMRR